MLANCLGEGRFTLILEREWCSCHLRLVKLMRKSEGRHKLTHSSVHTLESSGKLTKTLTSGPCLQSSGFKRSGVRPKNLHFENFQGDADAKDLATTL